MKNDITHRLLILRSDAQRQQNVQPTPERRLLIQSLEISIQLSGATDTADEKHEEAMRSAGQIQR